MKLLFDANLSPKLVWRLNDLFPESCHVFETNLIRETKDIEIWEFAKREGFTIITADLDFVRLSQTLGLPPKVIRIEKCDFRTSSVEALIRNNAFRIAAFETSHRGLLILRNPA